MSRKVGTKLEACANHYTFVWRKSVGKWEEKMFVKIEEAIKIVYSEYRQDFSVRRERRAEDLQRIFDYLDAYGKENQISFVHGSGKRGALKKRSANGKTWDMMSGQTPILVIREGI